MDMKKILQKIDQGITSKVEAGDIKKFVSIINEGANPYNRLTQAESIAVNHYAKEVPVQKQKKYGSGINQYFKSVEKELLENTAQEQASKASKAKQLSERAIKEVGGNYGHASGLRNNINRSQSPPDNIRSMAKKSARRKITREEDDTVDTVVMDIPLFIRLLEYAKEDAKTDMDLHNVAEKAIALTKKGTLTMDQYDVIVGGELEEDSDPCWKNYKQIGTKKKNGKTVPNCVPKK